MQASMIGALHCWETLPRHFLSYRCKFLMQSLSFCQGIVLNTLPHHTILDPKTSVVSEYWDSGSFFKPCAISVENFDNSFPSCFYYLFFSITNLSELDLHSQCFALYMFSDTIFASSFLRWFLIVGSLAKNPR